MSGEKNMVCDKCGQRFNDRQELKRHEQMCAGKGAQQSGQNRPMTRGAGGGSNPTE